MKPKLLSDRRRAVASTVSAAAALTMLIPLCLQPDCAATAAVSDSSPAEGATISPPPARLAEIREQIRTDAEARGMFEKLEATAKSALTESPAPIALIQTEGKLQKDPLKIATWRSLGDMGKINALAWTYALGDPGVADARAAKAKEFILAWADTNRSKGDPIDDTNLEPLLVGYDLTRGAFTPAEQARVETYLRQVAGAETQTGSSRKMTTRNNWNSHRLKIVGLIAFLLRDKDMISAAVEGYQRQIETNLRPDGSSLDFEERDALHYHLYDLEPLLTLAIAARQNGVDLYNYTSPSGASLAKSVQWVIPYCDGTKTHEEYVHSKVSFDRKRGDSGDPKYKAGRMFEPNEALKMLALAAAFDPRDAVLERTIDDKPNARFVSWEDVLNSAATPASRGTQNGSKSEQ